MDQPKIERLLRLLKLLTSNDNYTIADVAARLKTSERTIYRYLDTMKAAGFAVIKNGEYYRLSMESEYFKDISKIVHFTEEEGYIFNHLMDQLTDDIVIKANLRKKLAAVYNSTNISELVLEKNAASKIGTITESIENKQKIHLRVNISSDTVKEMVVEAFAYTSRYKQLWCYDLEDSKNKLLRLSQIVEVEVLDEPWEFEAVHKKGFLDVFRISGFKRTKVKLMLNRVSYEILSEEYPMSHRYVKQISEQHWILDTKVCSYQGVGRFYMGLADQISIIDSPGFEEYVHDFAKRYLG